MNILPFTLRDLGFFLAGGASVIAFCFALVYAIGAALKGG